MKIYIAGPMFAPNRNARFERVADHLRCLGFEPSHIADQDKNCEAYRHVNFFFILINECDAICLMPGWDKEPLSRGAKLYAEALGKTVIHYDDLPQPHEGDLLTDRLARLENYLFLNAMIERPTPEDKVYGRELETEVRELELALESFHNSLLEEPKDERISAN